MVAPAKVPAKAPAKKAAPAPQKMTGNAVIDAERVLQAVGLSLGQVVGELFPLERDDTVRTPKRTSLKNVQSQPVAVLMVEWDEDSKEDIDNPLDRDLEGFDDHDAAKQYFDINVEFARQDIKEYNDARHLVVLFNDTNDLLDFTYDILTPKTAEADAFNAKLKARLDEPDISFMFYGEVSKDQIKAPKAAAGPKVAGRKLRDPNAPAAKKIASKQKPEVSDDVAKAAKIDDLNKRLQESREKRNVDSRGRRLAQAAADEANGTAPAKVAPRAKPKPVTVEDVKKDTAAQAAGFAGVKRPARKKATPKAVETTVV